MSEIVKKPGSVLCNQEIAESIDRRLRNQARGVAHSMERFKSLIDEAKTRCIYPMLGFKSWTAYAADVIGKEMHQLPVDDRRQIIVLLAGEGMSNRAIADAVGVNEITVRRDREQVRHDVAPDIADANPVEELVDAVLAQAAVEGDASDENISRIVRDGFDLSHVEQKPIVGRDDKSYPAKPPRPQEPSKPREWAFTVAHLVVAGRGPAQQGRGGRYVAAAAR